MSQFSIARGLPIWLERTLVAGLYGLTAWMSYQVMVPPGYVCPIWLPSGVILAAVLWRGYRVWPGIFIGAVLGNIGTYWSSDSAMTVLRSLGAASGNGCGDTLGVLLAVYLLRQLIPEQDVLTRSSGTLAFLGLGILLNGLLSGVIGVVSLAVAGWLPWAQVSSSILVWWSGGSIGGLIVAPAILVWAHGRQPLQMSWGDGLIGLAALTAISWMLLWPFPRDELFTILIGLYPPLLWASVQLDRRLTFTGLLGVTLLAMASAASGHGLFSQLFAHGPWRLQLLLISLSSTVLVAQTLVHEQVQAIVAAQRSSEFKLQVATDRYQAMVSSTLDGFWVIDTDRRPGQLLEVNEAYCGMVGYCQQQLLQMTVGDLDTGDTIEPAIAPAIAYVHHILEQGSARFESRHRGSHGQIVDVEVSARYLPDYGCVVAFIRDISQRKRREAERKQAELALQTQERQLRLITDALPVCISYIDAEQRYRFANKTYEGWFGHRPEELYGQSLQEVLGDSAYRVVQANVERVLAGQPVSYEATVPYREGSSRHIKGDLIPDSDDQGHVLGYYALISDLSQRKRAELALQESEQRFRQAIQAAPFPIVIHAEDGEVIMISQAWTDLTGYGLEDIPTVADWTEKAYGERQSLVKDVIDQLYCLENRRHEGEFSIRTRDGNTRIWDFSSAPLGPLPDGRRLVISMAMDVTQRRQAEDALRESEEKFRQLAEHINAVFWITTGDASRILYVSPAYDDIWGESRQALYQDPERWLQRVHRDDQDQVRQAQQQRGITGHFDIEYRIIRADGTLRWISDRSFPVYNETGDIYRITGLAEDITAQKQTTLALAQKTAELERSNRDLEQFAYVASHDLREPLRKVKSFTELLAQRYGSQLDERAQKYIYYIVDGAERMQTLISDLLIYSRAGRTMIAPEPVDLNQLVAEVMSSLQLLIQTAHATVTVDDLPVVWGHASQLHQVFQNLIANGIKFCQRETPQIHISAQQKQPQWIISVRDNGIGIEPEHQERIFGVFQRLHARSEYEGTGIGLAVCKRIVEGHGGQIWLHSIPDQGTTFYFSMPVTPPPS
ncbi:Solute:Sodium Symporter [Halomicronema hongdechloris C2206]|uniref:histidine kinase n=1 Tax=Halomicronema hongdechloris C2206 TaxID=1641165 RepID=A0A1Z3HRG4_9CYAN|nr:PAS domain S-box protein [Halomicronema hongdechloris]ASC72914.1 Solute:Sodium Symporter [Halomicronema hongdechloris C2206]